jgi:hypothetical protein
MPTAGIRYCWPSLTARASRIQGCHYQCQLHVKALGKYVPCASEEEETRDVLAGVDFL